MAANMEFSKKLAQISQKIPLLVNRLPGIAKVEGLRFISDNFAKEGFEEKTGQYKPWPERKIAKSKKKLVGEKRGAKLKRSWQGKASNTQAEFTSALPYAEVHNEGLKAGRPPGFTMKQSEMIGPSEALDKRIEGKFDRLAEDLFK